MLYYDGNVEFSGTMIRDQGNETIVDFLISPTCDGSIHFTIADLLSLDRFHAAQAKPQCARSAATSSYAHWPLGYHPNLRNLAHS